MHRHDTDPELNPAFRSSPHTLVVRSWVHPGTQSPNRRHRWGRREMLASRRGHPSPQGTVLPLVGVPAVFEPFQK